MTSLPLAGIVFLGVRVKVRAAEVETYEPLAEVIQAKWDNEYI